MRPPLCIVLALLFVLPASAEESEMEDDGWQLARSDERVKVYTRPVEGSPIREFQAQITLEAPLERVTTLYKNTESYPDWVANCVDSRRVKDPRNASRRQAWLRFDMPFPAGDRDVVLRRETKRESPEDTLYHTNSVDGLVPPTEDVVRMPFLRSRWHFEALAPDRTRVTYRQHSDPGGSLPGFLVNWVAVDIPFETLHGLADELEEPE